MKNVLVFFRSAAQNREEENLILFPSLKAIMRTIHIQVYEGKAVHLMVMLLFTFPTQEKRTCKSKKTAARPDNTRIL